MRGRNLRRQANDISECRPAIATFCMGQPESECGGDKQIRQIQREVIARPTFTGGGQKSCLFCFSIPSKMRKRKGKQAERSQ
jgi:hypothetical protein